MPENTKRHMKKALRQKPAPPLYLLMDRRDGEIFFPESEEDDQDYTDFALPYAGPAMTAEKALEVIAAREAGPAKFFVLVPVNSLVAIDLKVPKPVFKLRKPAADDL